MAKRLPVKLGEVYGGKINILFCNYSDMRNYLYLCIYSLPLHALFCRQSIYMYFILQLFPLVLQAKYRCLCDDGWTHSDSQPACTVDVDECDGQPFPCSSSPRVTCQNLPGTFHCGPCPNGKSQNSVTNTIVSTAVLSNLQYIEHRNKENASIESVHIKLVIL